MQRRVEQRAAYGRVPVEQPDRTVTPAKTPDHYWQKLVLDNLPLAYWCLNRFLFRKRMGEWLEWWHGEALFALVKAARAYDPDFRTKQGRPVKFSTFATTTIIRHLIHVRRSKLSQLNRSVSNLSDMGREIREDHRDLLGAVDDDLLAVQEGGELDRTTTTDDIWQAVGGVGLTDAQRLAFTRYHSEGLTYKDLSRDMGVTPQRVRQLVKRAEEVLRQSVGRER